VPSSDTAILHDQVGFYNSQLMKESIRCIEGMITSHVNHFSLYGHSRIDNVESMQKLWSKILVELSKLKSH
jgi:predicted transcriptional regulator